MKAGTPHRPRHAVYRGMVRAAALWFGRRQQLELQRTLLTSFRNGDEVRAHRGGYLLIFQRERWLNAREGWATPLVRSDKVLSSAPLAPLERDALSRGVDVVLVQQGELDGAELHQLPLVEPATWLDASPFCLVPSTPWGSARTAPEALSMPIDAGAEFDKRTGRTLHDLERQREVLHSLEQLRAGQAPASRASFGERFRTWIGRAAEGVSVALASLLRSRRAANTLANRAPYRPGPVAALLQQLKNAFAGWLSRSSLMTWLGRKQAEYLQDLFERLAAHDDDEILRRAIPLGNGGAEDSTPALLPPAPRLSLSIRLQKRARGSAIELAGDLFATLRRAYEAVFERLDAAGRHEEAAFFLAEILGQPERAVSYLERHGRLELAAQLAEARELAPGLIVRQWFIAGNRDRAVSIAVREGAFEDACLRLERSGQSSGAQALRLIQAGRLASAGIWVRAAEIASGFSAGVELALRWLELARAAGELRGIALELELDGGRVEAAHDALRPLLGNAPPDQLPVLVQIVEGLMKRDVTEAKPLARELSRELLCAAANDGSDWLARTARNVAAWIGGPFKADQPKVVTFARRASSPRASEVLAASDAGTAPARDVLRFGNQFLVALGEAGVVLLSRSGKRVAHFEMPAEALVASEGSRVLCVIRREDAWIQVGRIELATRRSEPWGELAAACFASSFDGDTWLVAESTGPGAADLVRLDVHADRPRSLQRLPLPILPHAMSAGAHHCNVIGGDRFGPPERLLYELPKLRLRQHSVVPLDLTTEEGSDPRLFLGEAAAFGTLRPVVCERWLDGSTLSHPKLRLQDRVIDLRTEDADGILTLTVSDSCYAVALGSVERNRVHLLAGSIQAGEPHLDLLLHGAATATLRLTGHELLLADTAGRILGTDLSSGFRAVDLRT